MRFDDFQHASRFRAAWEAVQVARPVHYSLFTFGESDLPYFLVVDKAQQNEPVSIVQGAVKVTRPLIITPYNSGPEFQNFFENPEFEGIIDFLLARTAAFSHLKFDNQRGATRSASESIEEAVAQLTRRLDAEDEDRVAILTSPHGLGGLAIMKYACERVWKSAADNIQELRERGFLPES